MVALLLALLIASGEPFTLEVPSEVPSGETFTLTITCSEPGCSGIYADRFNFSQGLSYLGSSSSTSISTITTSSGRQLSQVLVYQLSFSADLPGEQTIGPITVHLGGMGSYTIDTITVNVGSSGGSLTGSRIDPIQMINSAERADVWLEGELRDPGGRIYPGTRLVLDYYVYARVYVENVTYWWTAPELGVIRSVETIPDSNWEGLGKDDNSSRSKLAIVEMTPAAPGSLQAPAFMADVTGTGFDIWGKAEEWHLETDPIILPVYPFPENAPEGWDGTLLDSVSVTVNKLPSPPGQGGELTYRVTCLGPGHIYMDSPPELTICGNSTVTLSEYGEASNKRWWDFILEPDETGCHVVGPDTLVWLDRTAGQYRLQPIEPCSLEVNVIPRTDREIILPGESGETSAMTWIIGVGGSVIVLTILLGVAARRRDRRLASVRSAEDLDELLTGLENELSVMLTGKREYIGFEELDDYLDRCDTDSLLSRRILRFWKDLEGSISDREVTGKGLERLRSTAGELLDELRRDLESAEGD